MVAGLVDTSHQNPRYCAIFRGKGRFPEEWDEDAPVPRALPVPNYLCGVPAYVKQSRCARLLVEPSIVVGLGKHHPRQLLVISCSG
jgi:hypothetical protein